eukprot:g3851.t1
MRLKRKLSEMSEEKSEENVGTMENVVEKKKEQGIASFFTKKTTTTMKKRKTKKKTKNELNLIKLPSGNVFDVMKDKVPEQVTHEFAQALVDRIKELTSTMKKTSNKKTSSPPTISKPSKTVLKGHVKQIVSSIKANLKSQKFFTPWNAVNRTVRVNQFIPKEVFDCLFGNVGCLIQPTPTNKPKSKVIIRVLSAPQIFEILGKPKLKGTEWIKGGLSCRARKLKSEEVVFFGNEIKVSYATTSQKLSFALLFNTTKALDHMSSRLCGDGYW